MNTMNFCHTALLYCLKDSLSGSTIGKTSNREKWKTTCRSEMNGWEKEIEDDNVEWNESSNEQGSITFKVRSLHGAVGYNKTANEDDNK